jgi:hypothetical protein
VEALLGSDASSGIHSPEEMIRNLTADQLVNWQEAMSVGRPAKHTIAWLP